MFFGIAETNPFEEKKKKKEENNFFKENIVIEQSHFFQTRLFKEL